MRKLLWHVLKSGAWGLSLQVAMAQQAAPPPRPQPPKWASFTEDEMAVVVELNRIRQHPKAYASYLRDLMKHLDKDGTLWRIPGAIPIRLEEGRSVLEETARFLEQVAPCPPLKVSDSLAKAAQQHVRMQGPTGETGHRGPDGSRSVDRIERWGEYGQVCGEIIHYGTEKPRRAVLQLVIDDGVPDRGHRKAIFNAEYRLAGPAIGAHKSYMSMTVVTLADAFTPRRGVK